MRKDFNRALLVEGGLFFTGALLIRILSILALSTLPSFRFPYNGLDGELYVRLGRLIASGDAAPHGLLHTAPLYSYWLGGLFRLFGDSMIFPRIAQALLGAAAVTLLWKAGRQMGGRTAGRIAGSIAAIYPPILLYEGTLQSAALVPFLVALVLVTLLRARSAAALLTCGLFIGVFVLDRPDALPLIFLLPAALLAARRKVRPAVIMLAGALITVLPFATSTSIRAGGFVPVSAHGGIHLHIGNHDGADGSLSPVQGINPSPAGFAIDARRLAESEEGRPLSASEVSRHWSRRALRWIVSHPGSFAALAAKKFFLFWNDYEIPNNEDLYFIHSSPPYPPILLPLFGLIAPLGVCGLIFAPINRLGKLTCAAIVVSSLAGGMIFFVTARYRLPAQVALIPLASIGAITAAGHLKARRFGGPALLAALMIFCNMPGAKHDFAAPESRMGNSHMQAGNHMEAEASFRRALEIRPGFPEALTGLAELYRRLDRPEEAIAIYLELEDHIAAGGTARNDLATLLAEQGNLGEAVAMLQELLAEDPENGAALTNLAACQMDLGSYDRAETLLRHALRIDPENAQALLNLGLVQGRRGATAEAADLLARHLVLSPRSPRALFNAGVIEALRNRPAEALTLWERLDSIDPDYPELGGHIARARAILSDRAPESAVR